MRDRRYLPEKLLPHLSKLENNKEFKRLVGALAEWLTLMEFCQDLVQRLQNYGITQYIDEEATLTKLNAKWIVDINTQPSTV